MGRRFDAFLSEMPVFSRNQNVIFMAYLLSFGFFVFVSLHVNLIAIGCRYTVFCEKFGKTFSGLLIERSMYSFEYTSIQTENSRVLSQLLSNYNCPESEMFYIYLFKSSCDSTFVSCIFSQNHSRKGTSDSQSNNHSRLSPSNSSALG